MRVGCAGRALGCRQWVAHVTHAQWRHLGTGAALCEPPLRADDETGAPAVPSWVLCTSLAEAHALASVAVDAQLREARAAGRLDLPRMAALMTSLERQLAQALHVPREVGLIEDLPMFLAEAARAGDAAEGARFSHMSEADLLAEFEEWVISSLPPGELPPAGGGQDPRAVTNSGSLAAAVADTDTMPFLHLMAYVHSYVRYHAGVVWGASRPTSSTSVGAYHRRAYRLHPWHGVGCPEGWAEQMPYVHVMQWMMGGPLEAEGAGQPSAAHWATESFDPPSARATSADDGRRFTALDVCCQSGYGVDLLLKAGAARVLAIDAAAPALGSTQATVHEHMRERRSTNLGGRGIGGRPAAREVVVRRCPMLPDLVEPPPRPLAAPPASPPASVFDSAAARRRQRARSEGRTYAVGSAPTEAQDGGPHPPFDVVYYHPPCPAVWSLVALPWRPPSTSVWWRLVRRALAARGLDTVRPLPFLMAPAGGEAGHAHHSIRALEELTGRLRADAAAGAGEAGAAPPPPLVADKGYLVCVLPRSYDPAADMASAHERRRLPRPHLDDGAGTSLSDFVVAQLDDCYHVVLRRRHRMGGGGSSGAAPPLLRHLAQRAGLGDAAALAEEVSTFLRADWWVDVLVMRRRPRKLASSSRASEAGGAHDGRAGHPAPPAVKWEDSFEYNEYKPRSSPSTLYHWTDLVPTYSYLEHDFYGDDEAAKLEQNFVAVGRPPALRRTAGATGPVTPDEHNAAVDKFKSVFAEELRQKRRTKLRKMALAPIEQQEWYIDEKLIKSEAAKVEFMNELSRWDFKDYDE